MAVEHGLAVFPLAGKNPLKGTHGFKDATTDPGVIAERMARPGVSGYGIWPASARLLGIDCDSPEDKRFLTDLGAFAVPTWIVQSGRAGGTGLHVYLRMPADLAEIGNVFLRGNRGCLVRCSDGYLVGPGSPHPDTGALYTTIQGGPSTAASLPPALDTLIRERLKARGTNKATGSLPERVPEHHRNNALASEAGRIARAARDGDVVVRKLLAFNLDRCDPPTDEREVRGIAKRIWENEKQGRAEGRKNGPRSSGPAVTFEMRSIDYLWSEPNALDDLGHLLDLARLIACNSEMLIETGHGRKRPAWVGDSEAEVAARYLENRWGWPRKKLRLRLKQWEAWGLIELLPPFRRLSAKRLRIKGWVRCDPLWGQASGASRGQPRAACKASPSNDVEEHRTTPEGQPLGGEKGNNSTASRGGGVGRWLRLSPNFEVSFPRNGDRAA